MKILVACETSGTVRNAFLNNGHDAWSCDVLPSDDQTNRHIQDDVRYVLQAEQWDMLMVAHPPCTRLCNSGVRWLSKPPEGKTLEQMQEELVQGASLFADLWNADVPRIAVENPIMHKHAKKWIKQFSSSPFPDKATQYVQPYEFAECIDSEDNVSKRTGLWLKNLPTLVKTGSLTKETARHDIHNASPSPERWKIRSKFHKGLAEAMADQWAARV
tara:strand:+ start:1977 stop:2624 length:648 start_codon:yes stop_codon:yes gene_type:complete